jgi:nucleoid-associated protein YgaU
MWNKLLKQLSLPESYISITLGFLVVIVAGILLYNNFSKTKQSGQSAETKSEESKTQEEISFPATHTIAEGENLWQIAEKYYGSGYNWVTLATENNIQNPDYITAGQTINIPKAQAIRPEGENLLATATAPEKNYSVIEGDNLWDISIREYGDGYAWPKIAKYNSLTNPDRIDPGTILKLPQI